ncbi:MAG: hypothetical protein MUC81_13165 [Bacteroidia bacterium]|jgi:hypothetical protein|nr:hypothetical protein [Bacteroidia bacterium]
MSSILFPWGEKSARFGSSQIGRSQPLEKQVSVLSNLSVGLNDGILTFYANTFLNWNFIPNSVQLKNGQKYNFTGIMAYSLYGSSVANVDVLH